MPRKTKKLLPWLIRELEKKLKDPDAGFDALGWENRRTGTFWLPWPRQMSKSWTADVSSLFLAYAKLQNRYKEGQAPEYVKWKTRLRTALNKDNSVNEIKTGHDKQNHRKLYQITSLQLIADVRREMMKNQEGTVEEVIEEGEVAEEVPMDDVATNNVVAEDEVESSPKQIMEETMSCLIPSPGSSGYGSIGYSPLRNESIENQECPFDDIEIFSNLDTPNLTGQPGHLTIDFWGLQLNEATPADDDTELLPPITNELTTLVSETLEYPEGMESFEGARLEYPEGVESFEGARLEPSDVLAKPYSQ